MSSRPYAEPVSFPAVDRVLRAYAGTDFTGAVARVEHRGCLVFERAYGITREDGGRQAVYVDTRFDLASLTKLVVATAVLQMVAQGRIALDESLVRWLPEWADRPQERITVRSLLAHQSGMHSGADYRLLLDENVVRYALERELLATPGERVIYSDLGFITLGVLLERVAGRTLAALAGDLLASPTLGFRPPFSRRSAIPATEDDGWRGRVQGVVHDEKAYLMGGVAGHAGLFGTAGDVARLTDIYLAPLSGRACTPLLTPELVREATREQASDPVLRRGLGWALKTSDENSCGPAFASASFGHTGFVGTCVWADPTRDVQGVLLTNAVYFGRSDTRDIRSAFYAALLEDLGLR